jgi:histidinol-phosphate phosphatase family protein
LAKAIFLDRDGVINELCYSAELRLKCAPFLPANFRLKPGVAEAINKIHRYGLLAIVISNQPDVGLGFMTLKNFTAIREKMNAELKQAGAFLDYEYYCMHHPEAVLPQYKESCNCHKPKPGLLLSAAKEHDIDLAASWFVGDNLTDVEAGQSAGCHTVLLACEADYTFNAGKPKPDAIYPDLPAAVKFIVGE